MIAARARSIAKARGFNAFRHRNYRLFWLGQLVSLVGTWMQTVAQGWLVLQLSNDPFALGVLSVAQFGPIMVFGLPDFKLPDAVTYPVEHAGGNVVGVSGRRSLPAGPGLIVVACDRLFEGPIGQPCRGPAEDALIARLAAFGSGRGAARPRLLDRFDASPRTSISVYAQ